MQLCRDVCASQKIELSACYDVKLGARLFSYPDFVLCTGPSPAVLLCLILLENPTENPTGKLAQHLESCLMWFVVLC